MRHNHDIRFVHRLRTQGLDQHLKLIGDMVAKSMEDPETRQLAVKIVSGSTVWVRDPRTGRQKEVIRAWGKNFKPPKGPECEPRDSACEIRRIWSFVQQNVRYVYDPPDTDTFATAKQTLLAGGGDCDDFTILFAALLKGVGFSCVVARVVSTADAPSQWVHVYPMVGCNKDELDPERNTYVPLDATLKGLRPGDQYPNIARHRDFVM